MASCLLSIGCAALAARPRVWCVSAMLSLAACVGLATIGPPRAWAAGYTNTPTSTPTATETFSPTLTPTPTPTPTPRHARIRVPQDFSTIQAAIDYAINGDGIVVSPGTYYENLHTRGKYVYLHGTDTRDWSVIANTVIDGGSRDSVITLAGTEVYDRNDGQNPPFLQIAGFTIRNGKAVYGGGVNGNNGFMNLRNCIVRDNYASQNGGGLYKVQGYVEYVRILNNTAANYGGGAYGEADSGPAWFYTCLLAGNRAQSGGGVYRHPHYTMMWKCTIAGNTATDRGGGLSGNGSLTACIVWHNSARAGGDIFGGTVYLMRSVADASNSLWADIYSELWWLWGPPSFEDPRFVDPAHQDFHLSAGSSAIGMYPWAMGSSAADSDLDFRAFTHGNETFGILPGDAGCFEYHPPVVDTLVLMPTFTPTPTMAGDVLLDGRRNHLDLLEFSMHWQGTDEGAAKADLDKSGTVDAADLLMLIEILR